MNVEMILKTEKPIALESRSLIHLILVSNKVNEQYASALKEYDISQQQFNVLRILRGQKGKAANLQTLNERMISKQSNTTRLVDKLLNKGLVNRMVCPSNRRKIEITITEEGKALLLKLDKIVSRTEDELLSGFSNEDLRQLNNLLDKF
ncbi:MarR family transcriptional regulator [Zeaxanthinibacter sp. PT1]|uniref:MarR family winged helix-turn-helix transcriptional regulator n=1 Tax=Zeaxanthinibacter TaxID=561554 RepID=UPI00234AA9A1|nr:MarR family transcriptional regulator [Zeaxanthinibacter sp. PT1]MDC6351839.1 MarR family transcriptional regulator [Zeaxanthinibacter sp. PT1]